MNARRSEEGSTTPPPTPSNPWAALCLQPRLATAASAPKGRTKPVVFALQVSLLTRGGLSL